MKEKFALPTFTRTGFKPNGKVWSACIGLRLVELERRDIHVRICTDDYISDKASASRKQLCYIFCTQVYSFRTKTAPIQPRQFACAVGLRNRSRRKISAYSGIWYVVRYPQERNICFRGASFAKRTTLDTTKLGQCVRRGSKRLMHSRTC